MALFVAQELTRLSVDEMKSGAGLADDRMIFALRPVNRRVFQPLLYVHASLRTFEEDVTSHACEYCKARIAQATTDVYVLPVSERQPGVTTRSFASAKALGVFPQILGGFLSGPPTEKPLSKLPKFWEPAPSATPESQ